MLPLNSGYRYNSSLDLAGVAELVDALDSKSSYFGSGGSIPPSGTILSV